MNIIKWFDSFTHWKEVLDLLYTKLEQILIIYRSQNDFLLSLRKDIRDIQWQITATRDEIKRSTIPQAISELSQTLVTLPKAVYTIVEEHNPSTVWGLIDLSDLHNGDEIELKVFLKLDNDIYKPLITTIFSGVQKEPIFQLLPRPTRGFKVELTQTAGISRSINYYWQWKKD